MRKLTRIAVIGTGTIGAGWAACFLSKGLTVTAYDPHRASLQALPQKIANAWAILSDLDPALPACPPEVTFADSLEQALEDAEFVQESGPEEERLKIDLFRRMDAAAPLDAVIASSSSSLLVSRLQSACIHPDRCLVGHPFNPPYLIPLVEIVRGPKTSTSTVTKAEAFYRQIGKRPLVLEKEIPGYIANRLQNALFKEAMHLIQSGAATADQVDKAVRYGPGLRWAFMGPFLTYALGGGTGMRRYFDIFGEEIESSWKDLGQPTMTNELREEVIEQANALFGKRCIEDVAVRRDAALVELLKTTSRIDLID